MAATSSPYMVVVPVRWWDLSLYMPRKKRLPVSEYPHSPAPPKHTYSWTRWWKTHLIRPSFRIRLRFPSIYRLWQKRARTAGAYGERGVSPEYTADSRQEQGGPRFLFGHQRIPRFQIKIKLPTVLSVGQNVRYSVRSSVVRIAFIASAFFLGVWFGF